MPKRAQLYIAAIVATGFTIVVCSLLSSGLSVDPFLIASLLLGAIISMQKVRLPGMEGTISGGFAFILLSIGKLDAEETVLMAVVAALVQSLWRCARRPMWYQVAFNVAALVICSWLAHHSVHIMVAGTGPGAMIARLCVAAMLLLVTNTFLVAVVISLIEADGLAALWSRCRFWAMPYYLAGAGVASAILVGTATGPAWTSLLLAPAVTMIAGYYRQCVAYAQVNAPGGSGTTA